MSRRAIIIGAGPAGLTAAYELIRHTDIVPVVLEMGTQVGGLSKTVVYKGNRMDIGGHRFFSKSDRVMAWWVDMIPLEREAERLFSVPAAEAPETAPNPEEEDRVMLVGTRRSRIFFAGKFFDYPISLSPGTLWKLGPFRALRIASSYARRLLFPVRPVRNLEDFMINRFGDELYRTFFQSYTEKVWGVPCRQISAAWGAQRIKDVSVGKALAHWLRKRFTASRDLLQKEVSTSMIERFLYPKFGPGQMWEETARRVSEGGGEVLLRQRVTGVRVENNRVVSVEVLDEESGERRSLEADYVFSSMPVRDLVRAMGVSAPAAVREAADALSYRDFIAVGLLVRRMKGPAMPDSWLYIQEPDVLLGRMQIYNNWSPYMLQDQRLIWLGLEYFCNEGDELWRKSDEAMLALAVGELARIGMVDPGEVVDGTVQRVEKAYPGYFGGYVKFPSIRHYLDDIENLIPIGRNGMHKYNNQDHSMLTAMAAVDGLASGRLDKAAIWSVNTEEEYLEEMAAKEED